MNVIIVMGVAGAGKTLIGTTLAAAIGWPFHDGDDYHSVANIQKMARGEGLTDADREPWLRALHDLIEGVVKRGDHCVLACSALKRSYRDDLLPAAAPEDAVRFVYLDVPREVLEERLSHRVGHFARPNLLPSQFATLEEPRDALRVDGTLPPPEIVKRIRRELHV